jgi:hypothetical protein
VDEAMKRFARQRFWGFLILALASITALAAHIRWSANLPGYAFLSGWALLAVMIFLALYNGRKKIPFLPAAKSEAWLQLHIYAGYFTVLLFAIHVNFRVPDGWFEGILTILFAIVTISGFVGLFLSRVLPKRLTTRGAEVIFERIPSLRTGLREEAEKLVFSDTLKSTTIAELYVRQLSAFFARPKYFWPHLVDSRAPLNAIVREIDEVRPFVAEQERPSLEKLTELVRRKDGLDYHYALQLALRIWLFVHLPITYALMVFSIAHIIIVFAFSGGAG